MRRPITWLALLIALSPWITRSADEAPQAPTGQAQQQPQSFPPAKFTTKVQGTVPDLSGRWLVDGFVSLQGQPEGVPISLFWEVTSADGTPNLEMRWGGLPPAIKETYDAAANQHARWEPTEQQLQALRDGWDTLPFDRPPVDTVDTTISSADEPGPLAKAEASVQGALFTVEHVIMFTPGPQRPTKDVMVFGAREALADGYRGDYAGVTIANAPFPIPIAFNGTFRAYRLGPVPQPGLLARLFSIFKGCGRQKTS